MTGQIKGNMLEHHNKPVKTARNHVMLNNICV